MWGCPLHPGPLAIRPHFSKKISDNLRYSILHRFLWILTSILEVFLDPKIDVFEKFLLPDFELQLEVRSAKIVILPRENAVFYKIDILALKWQPMKNMKKTGKTSLRNQVVFSH